MEETEADLVSKKPYLSEVLDYAALQKGRANIISATCHSGKTTAAKKIMEHHARSPGNVLYLIDTRAGKDACTCINRRRSVHQVGCTSMTHTGVGSARPFELRRHDIPPVWPLPTGGVHLPDRH